MPVCSGAHTFSHVGDIYTSCSVLVLLDKQIWFALSSLGVLRSHIQRSPAVGARGKEKYWLRKVSYSALVMMVPHAFFIRTSRAISEKKNILEKLEEADDRSHVF